MKITSEINKKVFTGSKKSKVKKENISLFLITINSNQSYHSQDKTVLERLPKIETYLRSIAKGIYEKNILKIIGVPEYNSKQMKELHVKQEYSPVNPSDIISSRAKSNIEANGDGRGFLHLQTAIRIRHKTLIQIRIPLLKQMVEKILEPVLTFDGTFQKPYVNVRGIPSSADLLFEYVSENI